ncbi:MAG: right-handed parallel beta-helix repeat-containing protein [Phycisphaerales bacterium]
MTMCSRTVRRMAAIACVGMAIGATALADDLRVPAEFTTIQSAIDAAKAGDRVLVADGVYMGVGNTDITFRGKAITVQSENGAASCIIDCDATPTDPRRGFVFSSGEGLDSVLDGFTITNGATLPGAIADTFNGAAILCNNGSSPTIRNCVLSNNRAGCWGGAFCCSNASPVIENCVFVNNHTDDDGGGLFIWLESYPVVINSVFAGNTAPGSGGGLTNFGGGITLINCTLVDNSAGWGSAGYLWNSELHNSIVWDHPGGHGLEGAPVVTYSNVEGGYTGVGNMNLDPRFVKPEANDYRLAKGSPSIDAGDNVRVPAAVVLDANGEARFTGAFVDQGAFENPTQPRRLTLRTPIPGHAGEMNSMDLGGAVSGSEVFFVYGFRAGATEVPGCPGLVVDLARPTLLGREVADGHGFVRMKAFVPATAQGRQILLQAVTPTACEVSDRVTHTF